VVIIGSGFDSRPYRFAKQMEKVRFYELDLPATQKRKQKILEDEFGRLPEAVTYIPINYRSQTFLDALKHAGYDENQKTLFIWEASMVFTERNIVENTLQSIAQNSAPESELVFGYVFDELVQGNYNRYMGAWYASVRLKAAGEPWTFGIPEGKANEFMVHLGFKVISDLGAKELAQKYLVRGDGEIDGKPTPFMRIMHAVVAR
jgi:methyltransferase (TIGR00027 family)